MNINKVEELEDSHCYQFLLEFIKRDGVPYDLSVNHYRH